MVCTLDKCFLIVLLGLYTDLKYIMAKLLSKNKITH